VLVTDPYDPAGYGGVLKYALITDRADAALISHDHADHNYADSLSGSPQILKGSGQVKDIQVKGIETHHDESDDSERGSNTVFAFTVDNVNVCFVGDLCHQLTPEQINAIGSVDILFIPVGGTYIVDSEGAAKVAKSLDPRVVVPMHFKTEKCDLPIAGLEGFLAQMDNIKEFGINEVELSSGNLPTDGPEVWVLNYAC